MAFFKEKAIIIKTSSLIVNIHACPFLWLNTLFIFANIVMGCFRELSVYCTSYNNSVIVFKGLQDITVIKCCLALLYVNRTISSTRLLFFCVCVQGFINEQHRNNNISLPFVKTIFIINFNRAHKTLGGLNNDPALYCF